MAHRRKSFSEYTLAEAFELVGIAEPKRWQLSAPAKLPSSYFEENMRRLEAFDTLRSEGARLLLVDAIVQEAIQPYHRLRIFKEATIRSQASGGLVDYLVAPRAGVVTLPIACIAEAKKDDFDKGLAQCLVTMDAAAELNTAANHRADVYGIVTNGTTWQFYQRLQNGAFYGTLPSSIGSIEMILGILDHIFAQCEANLP
jgi:hypothetical protein